MNTLLILLAVAAGPQFEAQLVDGTTVTGSLVELSAEQLALDTADGQNSYPVDNLLSVAPKQAESEAPGSAPAQVDLVDGSALVASDYRVQEGDAQITLPHGPKVDVPVAGVVAVRLQEESEAVAAEWSRLVEMKNDGDLLVVRKGGSLDYHKGIVRNVTDSIVEFELGGDVLPVKRSKVYGLVYLRTANGNLPESICRITDVSGSKWSVSAVSGADEIEWTTPAGAKVSSPAEKLVQIDFSGGKVVYLSDLKPESVAVVSYFGKAARPTIEEFYMPRADTNLESKPLQLDGRQYSRGVALHGGTTVVYRLPDRFQRFKAVAGIDDGVRPHGNVRLVVRGDDRVLWDEALTGNDDAKTIDVDVVGVRRLTIEVAFGDALSVGDHLDLCDARVLK